MPLRPTSIASCATATMIYLMHANACTRQLEGPRAYATPPTCTPAGSV